MINRSIEAGQAYITLLIRDNGARRALRAFGNQARRIGQSFAGFGAGLFASASALAAPILASAKAFADFGDSIEKAAARTGFTAESLSALKFAAEQSGGSFDNLEKGIRRFNGQLLDLERGTSTAVFLFDQIGVSLQDLDGLTPEQSLLRVADGLALIDSTARRTAVAQQLFGRSGALLAPLLAQGSEGIRKFAQEAADLGLIIDTDAAAAAAALTDAWNRVISVFRAVKLTIGESVAGPITSLADKVAKLATVAVRLAQNNGAMVRSILAVAGVVAGAGLALVLFGGAIIALGAVVASSTAVFGAIATAVTAFGTVLAAVTTPIGIVVLAITGIGAAVAQQTGAIATAGQFIVDVFENVKERAIKAFAGIADALAAGDLQLAAQILWQALRLEFETGVQALNVIWIGWKTEFLSIAEAATVGVGLAFTSGFADIQTAFQTLLTSVQVGVGVIFNSIADFTDQIAGAVLKAENALSEFFGLEVPTGNINEQIDADNAARSQERENALLGDAASAAASLTEKIAEIEKEKNAKLAKIAIDGLNEQLAIQNGQQDALAASRDRLAGLQAEYEKSLAAAAQAREEAPELGGIGGLADLIAILQNGVAGAVEKVTLGTNVGGFAAQIFGSGSTAERNAKEQVANQREQIRQAKKIEENTRNIGGAGAAVFAP